MSVSVRVCDSVCVCVCMCEWRGEFNRVVLVVQLGLIFHFILNPDRRRVFQLVIMIIIAYVIFNSLLTISPRIPASCPNTLSQEFRLKVTSAFTAPMYSQKGDRETEP
jgi:presenilin-like A22 family membrane protease